MKKDLYDKTINFDYSKLPNELQEMIKKLEEYDKTGDWFNYDILFDELEITGKTYLRNRQITEQEYEKILNKYGWLYDWYFKFK